MQIELLLYPEDAPGKQTGRASVRIDDTQMAAVVFDALQAHMQLCYRMATQPAAKPDHRPWAAGDDAKAARQS